MFSAIYPGPWILSCENWGISLAFLAESVEERYWVREEMLTEPPVRKII